MRNTFKRLIVDSHERVFENTYKRDYNIPLDSTKIISLIGVRRCGKSHILYGIINDLRKKIPKENIIYVNFEDDRLLNITVHNLDDLIEGYYELYPEKRNEKIYIFLDEVQVVDKWEAFLRRVHDTINASIYITGSSAKLLSSEISTGLRGRTLTYEIFPLSFKEYLDVKSIEVNLNSSSSLSYIKKSLSEYLLKGGFPEIINENDDIQTRTISDYVDLIIYRDIIERYGITNHSLMKHLIKYCCTNISTLLSFNKLYNEYKSMGYQLSKDTLFSYFSHLSDAYTLFSIPIYRNSVKEEQRNPKKIYAVDNGFKYIFDPFPERDVSKRYENAVFLHLRRKTKELYYFKGHQEVDFFYKTHRKQEIVNVSFDISNPKTRERELEGLVEAMEYSGSKSAMLITDDTDEIIKKGNYAIQIIPMYKFLLTT